jgi:hypothetical protein
MLYVGNGICGSAGLTVTEAVAQLMMASCKPPVGNPNAELPGYRDSRSKQPWTARCNMTRMSSLWVYTPYPERRPWVRSTGVIVDVVFTRYLIVYTFYRVRGTRTVSHQKLPDPGTRGTYVSFTTICSLSLVVASFRFFPSLPEIKMPDDEASCAATMRT